LSLQFRPPWWSAALAAAGCAAGIALGNWQSDRAADKRATAAAQVPLKLRGELLAQHTLYLQNRPHHGKPGYYVVQPLRQADGRNVLVLRGWSAVNALPPAPRGEVILEGVRRQGLPRVLEVGTPDVGTRDAGTAAGSARAAGNVRQNMTVGEYVAWSGLALEPYVIEQRSGMVVTQPPAPPDSLARDWPRAESGAERNDAYALQWYALAALSVILFVVLGFKRGTAS
jgi:surfeit locus 1 family protein